MLVSSQTDHPATAEILHLHVSKVDLAVFDRLAESKTERAPVMRGHGHASVVSLSDKGKRA
jgi:hypothetical protein